jgi:hypothetical protein
MPGNGLGDPWGYAEPSLKRIHRRLFRLNEKIATLEKEADQVAAELEYHRSINEDAQRDAVVGNYIDREEAGLMAADVRRFEKTLASLEGKAAKLIEKRDRLLPKLPD